MTYWTGDIPAEDIVIEPARNGDPLDLAPFTASETLVELRTFDGALVPADFLVTFVPGGIDEIDRVILEWPGTSVFTTAGLHTLNVTLMGLLDTPRERLAPIPIVVQADDGWHTLDSARIEWSDAESLSDVRLFQMLELARQQVTAYAPTLALGARPPQNYREGQLMQARNLLNSTTAEQGADNGESFVLRPYPLDWMVKQVLRPKTAVPVVG